MICDPTTGEILRVEGEEGNYTDDEELEEYEPPTVRPHLPTYVSESQRAFVHATRGRDRMGAETNLQREAAMTGGELPVYPRGRAGRAAWRRDLVQDGPYPSPTFNDLPDREADWADFMSYKGSLEEQRQHHECIAAYIENMMERWDDDTHNGTPPKGFRLVRARPSRDALQVVEYRNADGFKCIIGERKHHKKEDLADLLDYLYEGTFQGFVDNRPTGS